MNQELQDLKRRALLCDAESCQLRRFANRDCEVALVKTPEVDCLARSLSEQFPELDDRYALRSAPVA